MINVYCVLFGLSYGIDESMNNFMQVPCSASARMSGYLWIRSD